MARKKDIAAEKDEIVGADPAALEHPELAAGDLQERFDEYERTGTIGEPMDPTPNDHYSLESDDWRTPETDPEYAQAALIASRFPGHPQLGPGPKPSPPRGSSKKSKDSDDDAGKDDDSKKEAKS